MVSPKYSRYFYPALGLSILVHLFLFGWLTYQKSAPSRSGHGVVSVSFIQSISHDSESAAPSRKKEGHSAPKADNSRPEQPSTPGAAGAPGDPNAIAHESDLFISAVTQLVDQNKIFPKAAIDREEEGKVLVAVTLDRSGELLDSKIEEPSPFELLNEAALKTVRAIAKYPVVPAMVPAPIHLHIPLIFRIERN